MIITKLGSTSPPQNQIKIPKTTVIIFNFLRKLTLKFCLISVLETLEDDPTLQSIHLGVTLERLRQEIEENDKYS